MQDKHLSECLAGRESTEYILPFFWQHGENHDILARELDAIEAANLREFCVESRTHEQFCQDAWWEDFGFLLAEAQRRGMRVWLLDDKRFPTGYANGYVAAHPALRKVLLRHDWRDFAGPVRGARTMALPLAPDEEYVSVTAYRRTANGNAFSGEGIDLLPSLSDGLFSWDIPDGTWRVQFVIRTHRVAPPEPDWIDMLSPESCRAMLTAVYEPHYAHFALFRQYVRRILLRRAALRQRSRVVSVQTGQGGDAAAVAGRSARAPRRCVGAGRGARAAASARALPSDGL